MQYLNQEDHEARKAYEIALLEQTVDMQRRVSQSSLYSCLLTAARDGEHIQMQHVCHHGDTVCHPNSS